MAETPRRIQSRRSAQPVLFTTHPGGRGGGPELVNLKPFKAAVERLRADHPLRVLLAGEPDEIPRTEYAAKVLGWYRLSRVQGD